jgi:hypothetical protein
MHNQVGIPDHRVDKSHRGAQGLDILPAPFVAQGIFHPAFHVHHLQQGVSEQFFDAPADQRMEVPKPVNLDQVGQIVGEQKVRSVLEEQVRHIVQLHQPIQLRRLQSMLNAKFITQGAGRFTDIMDELRLFRLQLGGVMVNNHPIGPVQSRFETQVTDPGGVFPRFTLAPGMIMVRLQGDFGIKQSAGQPLQQHSRHQTVEVAFMSQDDFGFGQRDHA